MIPDKIYIRHYWMPGELDDEWRLKPVEGEDCEGYINKRKVLDFFFGCIGKFNHYSYFTDELWRKVKGFKDKDEGEVKCAFLSVWTKNELDIITYPVGSSWSCHCGSESFFNDYVEEWKPVFEDFAKWVESQR